jgi:hypothetical protein
MDDATWVRSSGELESRQTDGEARFLLQLVRTNKSTPYSLSRWQLAIRIQGCFYICFDGVVASV